MTVHAATNRLVLLSLEVLMVLSCVRDANATTLWAAPQGTGTLVTINVDNGTNTATVTGTFSGPVGANNAVSGLTLAENGASLLYIDNTGGPLYRLDPFSAVELSNHTLSLSNTGGLSFQTNTGTDWIFVVSGSGGVVRQQGFGGSLTVPFSPIATGSPGALGGDDNGRHFAAMFNGGIQEFSPATGQFSAPAFQGPPVPIAGLAYDGEYLYASAAATSALFRRNPDLNTPWQAISLGGVSTAIVGLAMAPEPPPITPPLITSATLNGVDTDINVSEGTASIDVNVTVEDSGTEDVSVVIANAAAGSVSGGNGSLVSDFTLSDPSMIDLGDEGSLEIVFEATDGTSSATPVSRQVNILNVAPTLDLLTASYNSTITLIDDDVTVSSGFVVPVGTEVTFAFDIDDPGLADELTVSFNVGGTGFEFGPTVGGVLGGSFDYTFTTTGDYVISYSMSDGDGGDVTQVDTITVTAEAASSPEPTTFVYALVGAICFAACSRRRVMRA